MKTVSIYCSTPEAGTTTATPNPNVIKKKYKYFDLESFEAKQVEKEIPFTPATNLAEANERIGSDEAILLNALNAYLRASALAAAEKEVAAMGGRKSIVLGVVRQFRAMPPFNKAADTKEGKAAQTKAILEMIKKNPDMIESIRQASLEAAEAGAEDEAEDEGAE